MSRPKTLLVSIDDLAQMIDHSLLHPTMTDDDVQAGLKISRKYGVATGSQIVPLYYQDLILLNVLYSMRQTIPHPLCQEVA